MMMMDVNALQGILIKASPLQVINLSLSQALRRKHANVSVPFSSKETRLSYW